MIELIKYEIYKVFSKKSIWIFMGVVLALQLIIFHFGNGQVKLQKLIQANVYENIEGPFSAEKLKMIENKSSIASNQAIGGLFQEEEIYIKAMEGFSESLRQKIADLNTRIQDLESNNQLGFEYRNLILYKKMITNIKIPELYMNRGWIIALGTLNRDFFVVLVLLYGVCTIFSSEYSLGTDSLILTSLYGKNKLIHAKLLSALVLIITVFVVITVFEFINFPFAYVLRGLDNSLQSVTTLPWSTFKTFIDSPYPLTIRQYILLSSLVRLIGCIAVGIFALFVSTLNKSSFSAFLISLAVIFTPLGFGVFKNNVLTTISDFSFSSLLFPSELFRTFRSYNIFGFPVLYLNLVLALHFIIILVLSCLTYRSFRNHEVY